MPIVYPLPPIEARPGPLPDAGPFLRIFAGVDEPITAMMRASKELIGVWRAVYERGRDVQEQAEDQLGVLTWVINREAKGHLSDMVPGRDVPLHPETYGDVVAGLAWKYVCVGLGQQAQLDVSQEEYELIEKIEGLDALVLDVMAGRVRLQLPEW